MPSDYTNPITSAESFSAGLQSTVTPGATERNTTAEIVSPTQAVAPTKVEVRQEAATKLMKDMQQPVNTVRTQERMATYNKIIQNNNARRATANTANVGGATTPYQVDGTLSGSRNQIMAEASSYLGSPYVFAGNTKQGIDCSGLVQQVYRKFGIQLPRLAAQQRDAMPGVRTSNINALKPGDLVAWNDGSHVAIYAGNGYIIQAANPRQGVIKSLLTQQVGYRPGSVIGIQIQLPGE